MQISVAYFKQKTRQAWRGLKHNSWYFRAFRYYSKILTYLEKHFTTLTDFEKSELKFTYSYVSEAKLGIYIIGNLIGLCKNILQIIGKPYNHISNALKLVRIAGLITLMTINVMAIVYFGTVFQASLILAAISANLIVRVATLIKNGRSQYNAHQVIAREEKRKGPRTEEEKETFNELKFNAIRRKYRMIGRSIRFFFATLALIIVLAVNWYAIPAIYTLMIVSNVVSFYVNNRFMAWKAEQTMQAKIDLGIPVSYIERSDDVLLAIRQGLEPKKEAIKLNKVDQALVAHQYDRWGNLVNTAAMCCSMLVGSAAMLLMMPQLMPALFPIFVIWVVAKILIHSSKNRTMVEFDVAREALEQRNPMRSVLIPILYLSKGPRADAENQETEEPGPASQTMPVNFQDPSASALANKPDPVEHSEASDFTHTGSGGKTATPTFFQSLKAGTSPSLSAPPKEALQSDEARGIESVL